MILDNDVSRFWNALITGAVMKEDNMWRLPHDTPWMGSIDALYNRQCYDEILEKLNNKTRVLIYGTPGIGKSVFLQVYLVHIVEKAKQDPSKAFPFIIYSRLVNNMPVTYHLRSDGTVIECQSSVMPDYRLSDSVDLNVADANILALEVASDNEKNYKTFRKEFKRLNIMVCTT